MQGIHVRMTDRMSRLYSFPPARPSASHGFLHTSNNLPRSQSAIPSTHHRSTLDPAPALHSSPARCSVPDPCTIPRRANPLAAAYRAAFRWQRRALTAAGPAVFWRAGWSRRYRCNGVRSRRCRHAEKGDGGWNGARASRAWTQGCMRISETRSAVAVPSLRCLRSGRPNVAIIVIESWHAQLHFGAACEAGYIRRAYFARHPPYPSARRI